MLSPSTIAEADATFHAGGSLVKLSVNQQLGMLVPQVVAPVVVEVGGRVGGIVGVVAGVSAGRTDRG